MTGNSKKESSLIFFDMWITVNKVNRLVGCFSVEESELEDISAKSIYQYIANNFDKFNVEHRYKFDKVFPLCWGFDIPHILTTDGNAIIVSNIHRL